MTRHYPPLTYTPSHIFSHPLTHTSSSTPSHAPCLIPPHPPSHTRSRPILSPHPLTPTHPLSHPHTPPLSPSRPILSPPHTPSLTPTHTLSPSLTPSHPSPPPPLPLPLPLLSQQVLLERWLRVWTSSNDQVFGQYLQLMHQYGNNNALTTPYCEHSLSIRSTCPINTTLKQHILTQPYPTQPNPTLPTASGVLKTEEAADRFFRIATELCVEACLNSAQPAPPIQSGDLTSSLSYPLTTSLSQSPYQPTFSTHPIIFPSSTHPPSQPTLSSITHPSTRRPPSGGYVNIHRRGRPIQALLVVSTTGRQRSRRRVREGQSPQPHPQRRRTYAT